MNDSILSEFGIRIGFLVRSLLAEHTVSRHDPLMLFPLRRKFHQSYKNNGSLFFPFIQLNSIIFFLHLGSWAVVWAMFFFFFTTTNYPTLQYGSVVPPCRNFYSNVKLVQTKRICIPIRKDFGLLETVCKNCGDT